MAIVWFGHLIDNLFKNNDLKIQDDIRYIPYDLWVLCACDKDVSIKSIGLSFADKENFYYEAINYMTFTYNGKRYSFSMDGITKL